MILNGMLAAAAEQLPWWLSAQSPWWAAPVATLAGALLAWVLARLTLKRAEKREDQRALQEQKLRAYSEFWATGLAFSRSAIANDIAAGNEMIFRASENMLTIELFGTRDALDAAQDVVRAMHADATSDQRSTAMRIFRERVAADLRGD